jgi:hypothetical protein
MNRPRLTDRILRGLQLLAKFGTSDLEEKGK